MNDKQIVFIEEEVRKLDNGSLISLMVDFDLFHLESDSDIITFNRQELIQQILSASIDYYTVSRYNYSPDEERHGNYILDLWTDYWRFA